MPRSTFLAIFNFLVLLIVSIDAQYGPFQARPIRTLIKNSSGNCQVNGQQGSCLLVNNCALVKILLQQSREQGISYLKQNQCSFNVSRPLVCCVSDKTYFRTLLDDTVKNSSTSESEKSSLHDGSVTTIDVSSNPYLPNVCGRDLSQKTFSSNNTYLDEFPWMVLLEYQTSNITKTLCSGALINRRYILTNAQCIITSGMPMNWQLTSVRLGEYNTDTEIDCVNDDQDNEQCADRPISVGIEENIVHEGYEPSDKDKHNDIALLRLNHDVSFTKFIRPICLPTTSYMSDKLYVAGWHKKSLISNIKLKQSLLLVDKMKCRELYRDMSVRLGDGYMCASGQGGENPCIGDSGGPLMSFERLSDGTARWTAVGVLSFGLSPCGMRDWPDVYTKIYQYVPWILSKIRA